MLSDRNALMQAALPAHLAQLLAEPGKYSPADFRLGIQSLMAEGNMGLAQALTDSALALFPESEDILAMAGLMAMANAEWADAIDLLEQLVRQQGIDTPAMTYRMLVRALRCNLEPARAQMVLMQGLQVWPADADLLSERDDYFAGSSVMAAPTTAH